MGIKEIIKKSILNSYVLDLSVSRICITLLLAAVIGIYIFFVYRMTVNDEFYSKDFNRSMVIVSVITAAITLTIQSNLVISLGMVGALSIVRYRTAIKSSIDLMFLFWSISVGIIIGGGVYLIAILLSVVVTILLLVLDKIQAPTQLGLLIIHCDLSDLEKIESMLKEKTKVLRMKNEMSLGDRFEVVYEFKSKEMGFAEYVGEVKEIQDFSILNYDRNNRI
ncbi:MAG: DUF4956 domain-containing protein [Lachnospiraceae bacterium]|nr:DUF4956 domain-containing protein [Lachnospiraceae bacterium]